MKQYMVVERFKPGCIKAVYERYRSRGRMLPDGLNYLDSWVNQELNICYQLMETSDFSLFSHWIRQWDDLIEFEIVPIDGPPQEEKHA